MATSGDGRGRTGQLMLALALAGGVVACGCGRPTQGLMLHPASALVRIGGPTGVPPPPGDCYLLELAMNESEAFQVEADVPRGRPSPVSAPDGQAATQPATAAADDDEPLTVQVQLERSFTESQPATAWAPQIRVYQVLDVHYTGPADNPTFQVPKRNVGWIPDVCLPTSRAVAQRHKPNAVTFLFDVKTPPRMLERTETFHYRLTFQPLNGAADEPAALELTVVVRPFMLPTRLPFKTSLTWNWGIEKYLGRPLTNKERLAFLDFFLDYRFTPASFFTQGPQFSAEEIKHIVARGGNVFQLYQIGSGGGRLLTDKQKEDLAPKLKQWRELMKDCGALDFCYALIADEPAEKNHDAIRANAIWLKGQFPELKMWVASRPRVELLDVVDCWDAVTAHSTDYYAPHSFTAESYRLARSAGNKPEYWWFYSVEPYAPHPNCRVDDALIDGRAIGYLSFAQGMDGFEYFWATDWADNAGLLRVKYPEKAEQWNLDLAGAGMLCLPDENGQPLPTLRLINLRDGFEDWAAFALAGPFARSLAPVNPRNPVSLSAARRLIYEHLGRK